MVSYEESIAILETELGGVEAAFRGLTDEEWQTETKLAPLDPAAPHWTLFELAGHFDISIGLTRMLIADPQEGQPGRDRVSFFIFHRTEVAPVVYSYAYQMVAGKAPADMPDVLHETFSKTIEEARSRSSGADRFRVLRPDASSASSSPAGWSRPSSTGWTSPMRWAGRPSPPPTVWHSLPGSSTSCWRVAPSPGDQTISATIWPGCGRRRGERSTTTPDCR